MGYWYASEFEAAYARLEDLCHKFPGSPHALQAVNDAHSQIFSNNLTDMRSSINALVVETIKRAPENPYLRIHPSASSWLTLPGHTIETMEKVCGPWITAESYDPSPHFFLGHIFARSGQLEEADSELTKALKLTYDPRSWDIFIILNNGFNKIKGYTYRLRSEVRIKQERLVEALADSKLAQEHTIDSATKDIETEALIWMKLGYPDKAEETALGAYQKGSLTIESFLKELYLNRTKNTIGFNEWLEAKLEFENGVITDDQSLEESPVFNGKTLQGEDIDSKLFNDDLVVLNFWATTCGPCIGEMPDLNQLVEMYQSKVHFLACSAETRERIKAFLKKHPFKFKIIPNAREVEKAFDISSYPTHVVIKNGRILWKGDGASPKHIESLKGIIKRNLDGKLE